jgi:protein involved in polysaccharide export with SLBB domain
MHIFGPTLDRRFARAFDDSARWWPNIFPPHLSPRWLLAILVAIGMLNACSPAGPARVQPEQSASVNDSTDSFASLDELHQCEASGPLHELWQKRSAETGLHDFAVGPGDVLKITTTDLPELNDQDSRVDGDGMISLPLIGDLQVTGLSEDQVQQLIAEKAKKYQRYPRVHVFVKHYAGRNVQVMGMVAQPGTYPLNSPTDSILSVLGRAGGIKGVGNEKPATRVVLFPAKSVEDNHDPECSQQGAQTSGCDVASAADVKKVSFGPAAGSPGASVTPIVIDLDKPSTAGCLSIPARPGDILLVPAAGQVGVYGWVAHPGAFDVTPGLTVLGAITAAGGTMFSSNVELMRKEGGQRTSIPVDLSQVENGTQPDLPVQGGDVVLVKRSVAGAVPYAIYTLVSKFGTGMYLAPAM